MREREEKRGEEGEGEGRGGKGRGDLTFHHVFFKSRLSIWGARVISLESATFAGAKAAFLPICVCNPKWTHKPFLTKGQKWRKWHFWTATTQSENLRMNWKWALCIFGVPRFWKWAKEPFKRVLFSSNWASKMAKNDKNSHFSYSGALLGNISGMCDIPFERPFNSEQHAATQLFMHTDLRSKYWPKCQKNKLRAKLGYGSWPRGHVIYHWKAHKILPRSLLGNREKVLILGRYWLFGSRTV